MVLSHCLGPRRQKKPIKCIQNPWKFASFSVSDQCSMNPSTQFYPSHIFTSFCLGLGRFQCKHTMKRELPISVENYNFHNYRPQRSWGKVIFSQASVILSTGGGVGEYLGRYTSRTRYTPPGPGAPPPPDQVHPLGPGTPPGTRYTPPDQVHPPGTGTPPSPRPGTPPGNRYTPLPQTRYTPWNQVHPPQTRYTPLRP